MAIRIANGYVQVRVMHNGQTYTKNFGKDSPLARELAAIHLADKKKEILMGKFGIQKPLESKKFLEAALIWAAEWSKETNADGTPKHGERNIKEVYRVVRSILDPYFNRTQYDAIRPIDVERWRGELLERGLSGTGVNRYQAVLSSMFNGVESLIKREKIRAFKLPVDPETGKTYNPCDYVKKAPNVKRKRVLAVRELHQLYEACIALDDRDMWEICEMALKSTLRKKDLFRLESGLEIDTIQAKTQRPIHIPVQVLKPLRYANFKSRWNKVREAARLQDTQFRDLRKTGASYLKSKKHSLKHISEFLGHATERTTEIYMIEDVQHLEPLAKDLEGFVETIKHAKY